MTSDDVKTLAREAGFDLCGIAAAEAFPELRFLDEWLARGHAGEMRYMARTARRRADVREVVPSARSVISLGTLYDTERPYSTEVDDPDTALISRYAWGEDYHDVVGRRMEALLERMRAATDEPFAARCYVDTGPVQERVYAQHAGLGWIGKNTCLIHPEKGSWFFLSEIITSLPLETDAPQLDQCGTCTLCIEACPTDALREPWALDATRCLSYLTIEIRGAIPEDMRPDVGTHVYGCDICQEVCPLQRGAGAVGRPGVATGAGAGPAPAVGALEAVRRAPGSVARAQRHVAGQAAGTSPQPRRRARQQLHGGGGGGRRGACFRRDAVARRPPGGGARRLGAPASLRAVAGPGGGTSDDESG